MKQSERKNRDIIEAAVTEFVENGFKATRISAIAERANVSKRTLYKHFESKESLFEAILNKLINTCHDSESIKYDPQIPMFDQLKDVAAKLIETMGSPEYTNLSRVALSEFIRSHETARKAIEQSQRNYFSFENFITEAINDGKLREVDPKYAILQFTSLLKASTFWPKIILGEPIPTGDKLDFIISDTVKMFLAHYE